MTLSADNKDSLSSIPIEKTGESEDQKRKYLMLKESSGAGDIRANIKKKKGADMKSPAAKAAFAGVLACLALIFSYIEVLIPINIGVPGIKLGIANLVVLIALYMLGPGAALAVNLIRVLVAGLLFSGMFGALYSLAGALLSMAGMVLLKRTGVFSATGISMAGGVLHNLGQILVACIVVSNLKMFVYFPALIISGVISGALLGMLVQLILQRLEGSRLAEI